MAVTSGFVQVGSYGNRHGAHEVGIALMDELDRLRHVIAARDEQINELEHDLGIAHKDRDEAVKGHAAVIRTNAAQFREISELRGKLSYVSSDAERYYGEWMKVSDLNRGFVERLEKLESEQPIAALLEEARGMADQLDKWRKKYRDMRDAADVQCRENNELREQLERHRYWYDRWQTTAEKLSMQDEVVATLEQQVKDLNEENDGLTDMWDCSRNETADLEKQYAELHDDWMNQVKENGTLVRAIADLNEDKDRLEANVAHLIAQEPYNGQTGSVPHVVFYKQNVRSQHSLAEPLMNWRFTVWDKRTGYAVLGQSSAFGYAKKEDAINAAAQLLRRRWTAEWSD